VDSQGCGTADSVLIGASSDACPYSTFLIPTSFSPNGDGTNDTWFRDAINYPDILIEIFNRWGSLVHSSDKDGLMWDGKYKGKDVAMGTYYFIVILGDGTDPIKGNVTIGAPAIEGAAVTAKILSHLKGDKVIVFKKKRRKGYRVKNGHRQSFTHIQIESIVAKGAKKATAKKAAPKKEAVKVEENKVEAVAQDFSKMTVAELRDLAKEKGVTGISSMKKADLIAALS